MQNRYSGQYFWASKSAVQQPCRIEPKQEVSERKFASPVVMKGPITYYTDSSIPHQQQQKAKDIGEVCPGLMQEDIEMQSKRCHLTVVELVGEKRALPN